MALGLGTGRLVFRALTVAEIVLAAVLTTAMIVGVAGIAADAVTAALVGLWVLRAVQVGVLRPRLNGRTRMILAGETPPRSHLHRAYIALEGVNVVLLMILGVLLVSRLPA